MWSTRAGGGFLQRLPGSAPVLGAGSSNTGPTDEWLQHEPRSSKALQRGARQENGASPTQAAVPQQPVPAQPSDRLKQLAARARSEKLRAAVQQLKAGEGAALGSPADSACGQAAQAQATLASPAGSAGGRPSQQGQVQAAALQATTPGSASGCSGMVAADLGELLDEGSSLGDRASLGMRALHRGISSNDFISPDVSKIPLAVSSALARRVLLEARVEAAVDKAELPAEEALATSEEAGTPAGSAAAANTQQPLPSSRPASPLSSGSMDTTPYSLPPESDQQAATAAMQRPLEQLQCSFSSLGASASCAGRPADPPSSRHDSPWESATSRLPSSLRRQTPSPESIGSRAGWPGWALQSAPAVVTHAPHAPEAVAESSSPFRPASRRLEYAQPAWSGQQASASGAFSVLPQSHRHQLPRQRTVEHIRAGRPLSSQADSGGPAQPAGKGMPLCTAASLASSVREPARSGPTSASTDILEAWRASRYSRYLSLEESGTAGKAKPTSSLLAAEQQYFAKPPLLASQPLGTAQHSSQRFAAQHASQAAQVFPQAFAHAPRTTGGTGMAVPAPPALDCYSRLLGLSGQPPLGRPASTPPSSGSHPGNTAPFRPTTGGAAGSIAAVRAGEAALLPPRALSAEPASGRCLPAEQPVPSPGAAAAAESGDILERWRARRQQLQRVGGSSVGGYNYASLLLLLPPSSILQQNAATDGTAGQGSCCSRGAAAEGREPLALIDQPTDGPGGALGSRNSSEVKGMPGSGAQQQPGQAESGQALLAASTFGVTGSGLGERQSSMQQPAACGDGDEALVLSRPSPDGNACAFSGMADRPEAGTAVECDSAAGEAAGDGTVGLQPGAPAEGGQPAEAPAMTMALVRLEAGDAGAGSRPSSRCSSALWRSHSTLSLLLDEVVGELF